MSQRKIVVDDVEYQYSIGETHVKIHGFQAVTKETIGRVDPETEKVSVTPSDIKNFIRKNSIKQA